MPFKPKLVSWEQDASDASELKLPPDLVALGEQLRDDALYMADRYPADGFGSVRVTDSSPAGGKMTSRKLRLSATAKLSRFLALGVLATVLILLVALPSAFRFESPAEVGGGSDKNLPRNHALGDHALNDKALQDLANGNQEASAADAAPVVNVKFAPTPTWLLQDVPSPDLEGILDLLEEEAPQQATLSI